MLSTTTVPPVLALCAVQRLIIALITHIFPFIAAFLLSLEVPPDKVATYSGMAESLVSLGDLVFLPLLIQLLPHRRLIIASLLLSGLVASLMGFSTHIWQILLLRGLTALFSFGGFLASIALGEVVKKEAGSQAFSLFASATFMGAMLGSMIGGYLAEPEGRIPILGNLRMFKEKPYITPGLTMGILTVICAFAIWILVPETNPKYRVREILARDEDEETEPILSEVGTGSGKVSLWDLWHDVRFWHLNLVDVLNKACFFTCLTLMSTAGKLSPDLGGLGLSVPSIGTILSLTPLLTSINLIFLFPLYSDKISTRWILIISSSAWLLPAIFFPIATKIPNSGGTHQTPIYVLWYLGHAIGMTWWALRGSLTVSLYPDPANRAVAAGILEQSGNLGCILGVAGASRFFALSSQYPAGTAGRQIVWIWFLVLASFTVMMGACLPKLAKSHIESDEDRETDDERTPLIR